MHGRLLSGLRNHMPELLMRRESSSGLEYFCWDAGMGDRAYIVIDDEIKTLRPDSGGPHHDSTPESVKGLWPLALNASQWRSTRAVAFFPLLETADKNRDSLIPTLKSWLAALVPQCKTIYFFLDVYH